MYIKYSPHPENKGEIPPKSTHEIEAITEKYNTIHNWKPISNCPKKGQFEDEFVNHKRTHIQMVF